MFVNVPGLGPVWALAATFGLAVAQLTLTAALIDQEHDDTCYYVRIV